MLTATSGSVSATDTFDIEVINHAPVVSVPLSGLIFAENFASAKVDVANTFSDKDGDPLTYTVTNTASSVVATSISGTEITLTEAGTGSAEITVTAKDNQDQTVTNSFTVIVRKIDEVFGFTTENTGSNGLVESWVHSIHIENNNEIWMGTDMGLSIFNPSQNTWTSTLNSGAFDSDDKLWLVVSKSNLLYLVKYNLATKQVELNQQLFGTIA